VSTMRCRCGGMHHGLAGMRCAFLPYRALHGPRTGGWKPPLPVAGKMPALRLRRRNWERRRLAGNWDWGRLAPSKRRSNCRMPNRPSVTRDQHVGAARLDEDQSGPVVSERMVVRPLFPSAAGRAGGTAAKTGCRGRETGEVFIRQAEFGSTFLFEMIALTVNQCVTDGRMVDALRLSTRFTIYTHCVDVASYGWGCRVQRFLAPETKSARMPGEKWCKQ